MCVLMGAKTRRNIEIKALQHGVTSMYTSGSKSGSYHYLLVLTVKGVVRTGFAAGVAYLANLFFQLSRQGNL